jgi:hypothetical protein
LEDYASLKFVYDLKVELLDDFVDDLGAIGTHVLAF